MRELHYPNITSTRSHPCFTAHNSLTLNSSGHQLDVSMLNYSSLLSQHVHLPCLDSAADFTMFIYSFFFFFVCSLVRVMDVTTCNSYTDQLSRWITWQAFAELAYRVAIHYRTISTVVWNRTENCEWLIRDNGMSLLISWHAYQSFAVNAMC